MEFHQAFLSSTLDPGVVVKNYFGAKGVVFVIAPYGGVEPGTSGLAEGDRSC
jgi:hypothetical protein